MGYFTCFNLALPEALSPRLVPCRVRATLSLCLKVLPLPSNEPLHGRIASLYLLTPPSSSPSSASFFFLLKPPHPHSNKSVLTSSTPPPPVGESSLIYPNPFYQILRSGVPFLPPILTFFILISLLQRN